MDQPSSNGAIQYTHKSRFLQRLFIQTNQSNGTGFPGKLWISHHLKSQIGGDFKLPGLVEGVLAMAGRLEFHDHLGQFQSKLFYDSVIFREGKNSYLYCQDGLIQIGYIYSKMGLPT